LSNPAQEANKATVQRYFDEVIDGGNRAAMADLFLPGALQHFPGRDVTFTPETGATMAPSRTMKTTIHHWLMDGELVLAHLTHEVAFPPSGQFATQIGAVDVGGRSVHWDAMALFRLQDGKIAEEWVNRDELSILAQLDAVELRGRSEDRQLRSARA
jgi:predicted SnoaL-like aldol condensation-catalyzing enzyme